MPGARHLLDQARRHWRHALALYTSLGVPDADDVHACLTSLGQVPDDDKEDCLRQGDRFLRLLSPTASAMPGPDRTD